MSYASLTAVFIWISACQPSWLLKKMSLFLHWGPLNKYSLNWHFCDLNTFFKRFKVTAFLSGLHCRLNNRISQCPSSKNVSPALCCSLETKTLPIVVFLQVSDINHPIMALNILYFCEGFLSSFVTLVWICSLWNTFGTQLIRMAGVATCFF